MTYCLIHMIYSESEVREDWLIRHNVRNKSARGSNQQAQSSSLRNYNFMFSMLQEYTDIFIVIRYKVLRQVYSYKKRQKSLTESHVWQFSLIDDVFRVRLQFWNSLSPYNGTELRYHAEKKQNKYYFNFALKVNCH